MTSSSDESNRRGGGNTSSTGLTSSVIPAVIAPTLEQDLQRGVSTKNGPTANNNPITKRSDYRQSQHWYALRCTYGRERKAYELFLREGIQAFYPTITRVETTNGQRQTIVESRLPNILFAYGTFDQLKEYVYDNVSDDTRHIRFYYNRHHDGTKAPLIIPDSQMQSLITICAAEADDKQLEPYVVEKFKTGQRVRVTDGPFAGVEGIVHRYKGQQRVGIVIQDMFTVTTAYVSKDKIELVDERNSNLQY